MNNVYWHVCEDAPQSGRHTNTVDRHTDTQTDRQTDIYSNNAGQKNGQMERWTEDRQTDRQIDRQADRRTDRQTDRPLNLYPLSVMVYPPSSSATVVSLSWGRPVQQVMWVELCDITEQATPSTSTSTREEVFPNPVPEMVRSVPPLILPEWGETE